MCCMWLQEVSAQLGLAGHPGISTPYTTDTLHLIEQEAGTQQMHRSCWMVEYYR